MKTQTVRCHVDPGCQAKPTATCIRCDMPCCDGHTDAGIYVVAQSYTQKASKTYRDLTGEETITSTRRIAGYLCLLCVTPEDIPIRDGREIVVNKPAPKLELVKRPAPKPARHFTVDEVLDIQKRAEELVARKK